MSIVTTARPDARYSKILIGDQNHPSRSAGNEAGLNGASPTSARARCAGTSSCGTFPTNRITSSVPARCAASRVWLHRGPVPRQVTRRSTPRDMHCATACTRSIAPCHDRKLLAYTHLSGPPGSRSADTGRNRPTSTPFVTTVTESCKSGGSRHLEVA